MTAKPVELAPEAREELSAAQTHYDGQRAGLGVDFLEAVREAIHSLQLAEAHAVLRLVDGRPVRRAHVRRFPYRVVFLETDEVVLVLAIAHTRRRPGYWLERLQGGS